MMDENEGQWLMDRLHALRPHRVDPAVESGHLAAMAQVGPSPRRGRRRLLLTIALAALLVVSLLGSSAGLAVAGVNAGPITALGAKIAAVVGIEINNGTVTHGTTRNYGEGCLEVAPGQGAKNHGQYLKWVRENRPDMLEAAKASNCGKPVTSDQEDGGD